MADPGQPRKRAKLALAAVTAGAGLALLVFLAFEVVRKLELLDTASSDNVQWTLAQAEVEFLDLQTAIANARQAAQPDLGLVRREFDIFYSRVQTISASQLYGMLRADAGYAAALGRAERFIARAVPLIDASDARLTAALPRLAGLVAETRPAVRALSVNGLEYFAAQADLRREAVATTLWRLAAVTIALLSFLLLAALVLARLYRLSERRAGALQLATSRLGTIVRTSLDAILVADRAGRILEFNEAAERIFGWKRSEILGRTMSDTIVPDGHRAAHERGMARYRRGGERHVTGRGRLQLEARRADGEVFPAEMSVQSAEGVDGEIFVSFIRDISHRVAAERELVTARDQAVAGEKAKTEFLAVMSHEIRTPLNGLLGTLSLLKDTRLTARQRGYLENMEASGGLLLNHVNDVLDISKYEAGKLTLNPSRVDLAQLVQSVIDNQADVAAAAGNSIDWCWRGEPMAAVETDALRLRQILINLVSNAVKFTRDGRITVEIAADRSEGEAPQVAFRVRDTGVGIAAEALDRIFRDFETVDSSYGRSAGGAGLGLGIARRLARALGGRIEAASEPGRGSVFQVSLPMKVLRPEADETAARPDPGAGADKPRRAVLVIEDDDINRAVLSDMLKSDRHVVVEAKDGREGVQRAAARAFDLVLMDISMPVMDGRAAAREIRSGCGRSRDAPIIAVTAHALPGEVEEFRRHGMSGYLCKPIDRAALRRLLAVERPATPCAPAVAAADGPPHATGAIVDHACFFDMQAQLGADMMARLLERFLAEGDGTIAFLRDVEGGDWTRENVRQRAHKLAGVAATLGATQLRGRLAALETTCAPGGDMAEARRLCADLDRLWASTTQALGLRAVAS